MGLITKMAEWLSKLHFLASLAMFFFIVLMVVNDDIGIRAILLVPVVFFYALSKVMYSIDQKVSTDEIIKKYKNKG